MPRVSIDDLEAAAAWLEEFDNGEADPMHAKCHRVAAWLRAEADSRILGAAVRYVAKETGATPAAARATLGKVMKTRGGTF